MGSEDRLADLKDLDESSQGQDDESDVDDEQPTEPGPGSESDDTSDSESSTDAGDESDGESDAETETKSTPPMTTSEDEPETAESESAASSVPDDPSESEPAFTGDDYTKHTIYSIEETWNEYTDAMDQMDLMILRQQFDMRNVTARERNEAMFRLARDHPELIAERVLEARGYDVDLSDTE